MSTVQVEVPHALPPAEVQARLARFSEDLGRVGARLVWKGARAEVQGIGVSGDVHCEPGRVRVALKLGMAARIAGVDPVRLEATLRRRLEEALKAP